MINIIVVQLTFRPLSNSLKSVFQTVLWVMCKLILLRCPAYCWVLPLPQGKWKSLSHVFETSWTVQSMEFSRPEYWSGLPFPPPGDLSNPGMEPRFPALQVDSLPSDTPGSEWIAVTSRDLQLNALNRKSQNSFILLKVKLFRKRITF